MGFHTQLFGLSNGILLKLWMKFFWAFLFWVMDGIFLDFQTEFCWNLGLHSMEFIPSGTEAVPVPKGLCPLVWTKCDPFFWVYLDFQTELFGHANEITLRFWKVFFFKKNKFFWLLSGIFSKRHFFRFPNGINLGLRTGVYRLSNINHLFFRMVSLPMNSFELSNRPFWASKHIPFGFLSGPFRAFEWNPFGLGSQEARINLVQKPKKVPFESPKEVASGTQNNPVRNP